MRNVFIFLLCCFSTGCGSSHSGNDNPLGMYKHYTEYPKDDPATARKAQEIRLVISKELNSECQ